MNIPSEKTQYGNPGSARITVISLTRRLMTLTLIVIVSERQQQGMNYVYTREF